MNQDDVGATAAPSSADFLLAKRKRGRPRKDENLLNSDNASGVGRVRRRRRKADSTYSDNAMVGQIVSGVLDGSFDSGYLLTVRVGDTRTVLRGAVFEPGRSVPITATNDVAPHVKMFQRAEVAVPTNEQYLTPASIHMIPPVFKSDRSSRRLCKNDPSHRHRISPNDIRMEQAAQSEKCLDELSQKQAAPLAEMALENDSCKPLLATSQSLDVYTKAAHTVDTSKKNEATLPEGQSHETGQTPLTASESENGSSLKKGVTHDMVLAQLKQPHNDVKEASDGTELAEEKRSLNEGKEVPAVTPLPLLSKVKTEDLQDMPKEFTVPLPLELPCDANEESMSLKTDITVENLDTEPQDAITSQKNEDVPSQHEATKASGIQGAKQAILALDEPDASEDKEVVSQALDIKSDNKQPLLQIHPEFEGTISMDVPTAAVHGSFSEAKIDKLVDAMKFGDDSALPKTESASHSGVGTLCGTLQNVHPAAGTDQLAGIGILEDEKFVDVPVVKSLPSPNQSAATVPEESLMPDAETAGQTVASNHGDEIDDPQGLKFNAVDKPVVVAEEPLLPDVGATSNQGNEIVDPQSLQLRSMSVDTPDVVPEELLLPDLETAGGTVASNQRDEIDHADTSQVLQVSDNSTNLLVEKPSLCQDGLLSDDAVILEASNNGNFGGWEEVMVESCQPIEEAAKVSGAGVDKVADHP